MVWVFGVKSGVITVAGNQIEGTSGKAYDKFQHIQGGCSDSEQ